MDEKQLLSFQIQFTSEIIAELRHSFNVLKTFYPEVSDFCHKHPILTFTEFSFLYVDVHNINEKLRNKNFYITIRELQSLSNSFYTIHAKMNVFYEPKYNAAIQAFYFCSNRLKAMAETQRQRILSKVA